MIVDGAQRESIEYKVLLAAHRAGKKVEYSLRGDDRWFPRTSYNIGKEFKDMMVYRLAENQDDS